jgi:hypothetical protein
MVVLPLGVASPAGVAGVASRFLIAGWLVLDGSIATKGAKLQQLGLCYAVV